MDKNSYIGLGLIVAILIGFSFLSRPSKEQLAERQRINDSIRYAKEIEMQAQRLSDSITAALQAQETENALPKTKEDSLLQARKLQESLQMAYSDFAVAAQGENATIVMENEKVRLSFSTLGGVVSHAELKEYHAYGDTLNYLSLFRADESQLAFTLITANNRVLSTQNLYFQPIRQSDSVLVMRLNTAVDDSWLDFVYTLGDNDYMLHFSIVPHNIKNVLAQNINSIEFRWQQLIPQQERGRKFEERYAQLQYMLPDGEMEKLSESKHDTQKESTRVRWIAYKDQFFSTVFIASDAFTSTQFESTPQAANSAYIKQYTTTGALPFNIQTENPLDFRFYFGPNHYNTLKAYDKNVDKEDKLYLKELVPLGWKIVSWINKILVIPMFDLFSSWGLHIGLIILLMTFVIKLIILPFVFASYRSSAKMRVLKPQIEEINAKYPQDKLMERQQAMSALYKRAGVSPMSGCLPMLFQFPVLMAMFWFFPTAIELRGQSFLWADDLSAYDAILTWSYNIPLIGNHLSLFCILMTITNIAYTYINMQSQSMGSDPSAKMMKWMMYLMPLMFFFIFNDYAAGLSYYYLLSLFFTIIQTMIFRLATNDEKILAQMEANAKKREQNPKKKSGFMARLEQMHREQMRVARENAKAQQRKHR